MREIKIRAYWQGKMAPAMTFNEVAMSCSDELPDDMKIMQYTGLKDKNRVDIYEGDIVEKDVLGKRGVVLWFAPTYAGYIIFHPKAGYVPQDWDGTYNELDGRHGAFGDTHKLQVIGNIYENPELLEASHV